MESSSSDEYVNEDGLVTPTKDETKDLDNPDIGGDDQSEGKVIPAPVWDGEGGSTDPKPKPSGQLSPGAGKSGDRVDDKVTTVEIPDVIKWASSILEASQKTMRDKFAPETIFGTIENMETQKLYVSKLFLPSPKPGAEQYPPPKVFLRDTHLTRLERAADLDIDALTNDMRACDLTCGRHYRRPMLEAAAASHPDYDKWIHISGITSGYYELLGQCLDERNLIGIDPAGVAAARKTTPES